MADAFDVLLFGDETGDFREPLDKLCQHRRGLVSLHFIESLNEVLRDEVRQQPHHVQEQIPSFTDIPDLVKRYLETTSRNPIIESILTCICQLASVMRCVSQPLYRKVDSNGPTAISTTIHRDISCHPTLP